MEELLIKSYVVLNLFFNPNVEGILLTVGRKVNRIL